MNTYAWADLHGRFDLLLEGLQYINPEDKVYFLGDAADRGPDGWECIKYIFKDERFIYLKGNHEDLLVKAIGNITPDEFNNDYFYWDSAMNLWFWNGGEVTYNAIINDNTISPKEKIEIIHALCKLPFYAVYHNTKGQDIILSHSGYNNEERNEEKYIWDRDHLMYYDTWNGKNNEIIVHGHTPIELMIKTQKENAAWINFDNEKIPKSWNKKSAYWYGKNHKCNIDTGAVWNNNSILLNLDTWEEIIIDLN